MNLNVKISNLLKSYYVDYIGFADIESYQNELIKFGGNIVKDYKIGISIGMLFPIRLSIFCLSVTMSTFPVNMKLTDMTY